MVLGCWCRNAAGVNAVEIKELSSSFLPTEVDCCRHHHDSELFAACMVCGLHAASVVEVPCGHVTVCGECFSDYQLSPRCLRCRAEVAARVDVSAFLGEGGWPTMCQKCALEPVAALGLPCADLCLCWQCSLDEELPVPCLACGSNVERLCKVLWGSSGHDRGREVQARRPCPQLISSGEIGGSCELEEATLKVEEEISRLEKQLLDLRTGHPVHKSGEVQQPSEQQRQKILRL
eukprot:TRINITY_DN63585_c0_g1_i1.p1 TRINITY_DN63585_c0_g1~~TRINITY_DN63585_c0_g1_i1.p1  ORF type:complete len:234 (-),score=42.94 TRINITY_DN63585_c0_g1_i1:109-810(-)